MSETKQFVRRPRVALVAVQAETLGEDLTRAVRMLRSSRRQKSATAPRVHVQVDPLASPYPAVAVPPWLLAAALDHLATAWPSTTVDVTTAFEQKIAGLSSAGLDRVLAARGLTVRAASARSPLGADGPELAWLKGLRQGIIAVDDASRTSASWTLSTLRKHRALGVVGATAATVAAVGRPQERRLAPVDLQAWSELLNLHEFLFAPRVFALDATVVGSVDGRDKPAVRDVLIVGEDPMAVDLVGARICGLEPSRIPWLRTLAQGRGLDLQLAGVDLCGDLDLLQRVPRRSPPRFLGFGAARPKRPRVDPLRWWHGWRQGRWARVYERTPWGRLREDYRKGRVNAPTRSQAPDA